MKAYLKEIKFKSTDHTYLKDITQDINNAIKKAKVSIGFVFVNTKHTTLGIVVNEIAEPNLLNDILTHTLKAVPEDRRSTRAADKKAYPHPTTDYTHRCQDNPYCDEIDIDYNAASHISALLFSHPSVVVPIRDGKKEVPLCVRLHCSLCLFHHNMGCPDTCGCSLWWGGDKLFYLQPWWTFCPLGLLLGCGLKYHLKGLVLQFHLQLSLKLCVLYLQIQNQY